MVMVSEGPAAADEAGAGADALGAAVEAATGAGEVAAVDGDALLAGAAVVLDFDEQPATASAATATTPTSTRWFLRAMNMDPPEALRRGPAREATRCGNLQIDEQRGHVPTLDAA